MPKRVPTYRPPSVPTLRTKRPDRSNDPLVKTYSGRPWQRFRLVIKRDRVLCEDCKSLGLTVLGEEVHHIISPRERPDLTFDPGNVLLLCKPCHSRRTARGE